MGKEGKLLLSHGLEFSYRLFLVCKTRFTKDINDGNFLHCLRRGAPREERPWKMVKVVSFKHYLDK